MSMSIDRRTLLNSVVAAGAAAVWPAAIFGQQPTTAPGAFRFVHLTDIHVQPELGAEQGLAQALAAVEKLNPKPDFILSGGDQVFDAMEQSETRAKLVFDMFTRVVRDGTNLKLYPCLGNHDVFGWSLKSGITAKHARFGKLMFCETFDMPRTYYAFDHKGWRFYVLDTIQPTPDGNYDGYLDLPQLAWLTDDLQAKPKNTPAVVLTHIPILTVNGFRENNFAADANQYRISSRLMCRGASELAHLFAAHNVRLALSGHIHELDRIELRGVTYICDGAVSGDWWKGPRFGYEEGFGILDLQSDGSFTHRYHDYEWTARA